MEVFDVVQKACSFAADDCPKSKALNLPLPTVLGRTKIHANLPDISPEAERLSSRLEKQALPCCGSWMPPHPCHGAGIRFQSVHCSVKMACVCLDRRGGFCCLCAWKQDGGNRSRSIQTHEWMGLFRLSEKNASNSVRGQIISC